MSPWLHYHSSLHSPIHSYIYSESTNSDLKLYTLVSWHAYPYSANMGPPATTYILGPKHSKHHRNPNSSAEQINIPLTAS